MAIDKNVALTTLARVKEELGIDAGDDTQDSIIGNYINGASECLMKSLDRWLVRKVYTDERYESTDDDHFYVDQIPIVSVEKLVYRDEELVEDEDFELTNRDKDRGKIYRIEGCFWSKENYVRGALTPNYSPRSLRNIKIDYTAGFCTPQLVVEAECTTRNLPYCIEEFVVSLVVQAFNIGCKNAQGTSGYKAGSVNIVWTDLYDSSAYEAIDAEYGKKVFL